MINKVYKILVILFLIFLGGLDPTNIFAVEYRIELREAKARVDFSLNGVIYDDLDFSVDLLLHALESRLIESGK